MTRGKGMPSVFLWHKNKPLNDLPSDAKVGIERLQSVAVYVELDEYEHPDEAFAGADKKIKECLKHVANYLSVCQQSAPYLTSWLVYPISTFDLGTIHHDVHRFCDHHNHWTPFASNVAIGAARNLQQPLFFLTDVDPDVQDSPFQVTDELLAEAQMSLFRGMPRLTVLNSYGAVELLANIVFTDQHTQKLLKEQVPEKYASELSELKRRGNNRTDPRFLFHKGIKDACGRSLLEENKANYDQLLKLQALRHDVAHLGKKPSEDEARAAHKLCCEVAQWLSEVAGRPAKPLLPEEQDSIKGMNVGSGDSFSINSQQMDFIRRVLGVTTVDFGAIPGDLAVFVAEVVDKGKYLDETQVVIEALRRLRSNEQEA
jgi:hypothetical protein